MTELVRGGVPSAQQRVALPPLQDLDRAKPPLGRRRRSTQNTKQTLTQNTNRPRIKKVGPVIETKLQLLLAPLRQQRQRIMRRVVTARAGKSYAVAVARKRYAVDRIVLKHQQRIEQLSQ